MATIQLNKGAAQVGANLADFVDLLQTINTNAPLAKENQLTISDNNGGRIIL